WYVGHHSGRHIAACTDVDDANWVANEIANFTDWTRTADELRTDATLDRAALKELINGRTPGVFLHNDPVTPLPTTFTEADIKRVVEHYEGDDTDGLAIISGMAINEPFMHLDTETFNEAYDQVMRLVHPEHYAA
ncbi:hypothetical protein, partial [Streptomyces katrae]|uniref:hypothetical protein n=1 Tax=Streptomyces katrae TaxID=68223 RepID=UPI0004C0F74A